MYLLRPRTLPSSTHSSDFIPQQRPFSDDPLASSSPPSKKAGQVRMSSKDKTEVKKEKNRIKQRNYRARLASTIETLQKNNALLQADKRSLLERNQQLEELVDTLRAENSSLKNDGSTGKGDAEKTVAPTTKDSIKPLAAFEKGKWRGEEDMESEDLESPLCESPLGAYESTDPFNSYSTLQAISPTFSSPTSFLDVSFDSNLERWSKYHTHNPSTSISTSTIYPAPPQLDPTLSAYHQAPLPQEKQTLFNPNPCSLSSWLFTSSEPDMAGSSTLPRAPAIKDLPPSVLAESSVQKPQIKERSGRQNKDGQGGTKRKSALTVDPAASLAQGKVGMLTRGRKHDGYSY